MMLLPLTLSAQEQKKRSSWLLSDTIRLKEVVVKASKVRERGDTITYNIGSFADKNDRSLGDVLSKIPGFEVNKQNGQISYEGKPISKFYIEGLDMLGSKYGVATNSLPQVDVGSVQVMRNHQPIRVLEDFTYTDDAAVNIRMKQGAKSRWVASLNGGAGIIHHAGLWQAEGLALRLRNSFQTMFTYKTNNTGKNISHETTNLFSLDETEKARDYIQLVPPVTPNLAERHTLYNRSHALTANMLKRLSESSQVNVQVIYHNNRQSATGLRQTEYYLPQENRILEYRDDYLQKENELYALVKYEKNSERQYLKNSLSGDFVWSRQWLDATGSSTHQQYAHKPEYDIKDNLYIIRKYGRSLVSLYSNNRVLSRPQSLQVNKRLQHASQQQYATDTYLMGGTRLGAFNLSLKAGVNASLHRVATDLTGLPDTLGSLNADSRFGFARIYIEPKLTYKTKDIQLELMTATEYVYEKYSEDDGHRALLFSPDLSIRWQITPRLRWTLGGSHSTQPLDASRFHSALIMQDFQYLQAGYPGYLHSHNNALRSSLVYNDALKAIHSMLTVSRSFGSSPYTATRRFVGDYIILSAAPQKTHSDSWQAMLIASKGLNIWNSVVSLRMIFHDSDATMLQNGIPMAYNNQMLTARAGLDLSFWKDMHLRYGLTYSQSRMKMQSTDRSSRIQNMKHDLTVTIPVGACSFDFTGEHYHNQLADGHYKDFFLADIKAVYRLSHIDLTLSLTNLLNNDTYSYVVYGDMMQTSSTNHIRGRELLLSVNYKL